jgi:hypothetical protein
MFSSKRNLYLLFILSALLICSCSESTEPDNTINQLIPLKIGNTWNYSRTVYDSTGTVEYTENINSSVEKDTSIEGIKWYGYSDVPAGIYFTNKSNGYWAFVKANTGNFLNDTSLLVYKYPTKVGDIYGDPETPREVISLDEKITVPAGEFKVIHLITTYIGSTNYLIDSFETFIAPGVGIIKHMQIGKKYDGTKFVVYLDELESYTLK